jgi:hypothetical protein
VLSIHYVKPSKALLNSSFRINIRQFSDNMVLIKEICDLCHGELEKYGMIALYLLAFNQKIFMKKCLCPHEGTD